MWARTLRIAAVTSVILTTSTAAASARMMFPESIPDPSGTIHACYLNLTGVVNVIDTNAGQACIVGQTGVTWSQAGPQGVPGIAGLGISSFTPASPAGSASYTEETFSCPSGESALSGYGLLHAIGNDPNTLIGVTADGYAVAGGVATGIKFLIPDGWPSTDPIDIYVECGTTS